jgi:hypothetical protein
MHNFTANDLMLYISGEMPLIESKSLEQAMLIDTELFNYFFDMNNLWQSAQQLNFWPSEGFENRLMSRLGTEDLAVA